MRHKYPTSKQTRQALEHIIGAVAKKMQVSYHYLYAIFKNEKPDPYANFRPLFEGTAAVSLERALIYLEDLNRIYKLAESRLFARARSRFTGSPLEIRRELRDATDAAIDNRPLHEQIKETCEAMECLEVRLIHLVDRDNAEMAAKYEVVRGRESRRARTKSQ